MSVRRLVQMWFDVNEGVLRTENGEEVRMALLPAITFRELILINLTLVINSDLDPYDDLDATMEFEATIDKAYQSTSPLCRTLNSGINVAGDWGSGSTADVTVGEISVKMTASTDNFKDIIGTKAELPGTRFQLVAKDTIGNVLGTFIMPFRCLNVLSDSGAVPAEYLENFDWFEDPITGKKCLRIVNDDGEVLEVLSPMGV